MPRFLVAIGVIIAIILGGIFVFSFSWGDSSTPSKDATKQVSLADQYVDSNTKVRMIKNGPIISNQQHREVWVTVSDTQTTLEVIKGYQHQVIRRKTFNNNEASYRAFITALEGLGFTATRTYKGAETELGSCPVGRRYIFDAENSKDTVLHSWTNSCSTKVGTFAGQVDEIRQLFEAQVPDFNTLVGDVEL